MKVSSNTIDETVNDRLGGLVSGHTYTFVMANAPKAAHSKVIEVLTQTPIGVF